MNPDHKKAIEIVYKQFNEVLSVTTTGPTEDYKAMVLRLVRKKAKEEGQPELAIIGSEIIDMYWNKLVAKVSFDKLPQIEQLRALDLFNNGVKSALADYQYLVD